MTEPTQSKPFLRVLKLAYKLHKAGLTQVQTQMFLAYAAEVPAAALPSAAATEAVILATVFNETQMPKGTLVEMADKLGLKIE